MYLVSSRGTDEIETKVAQLLANAREIRDIDLGQAQQVRDSRARSLSLPASVRLDTAKRFSVARARRAAASAAASEAEAGEESR